MKVFRPTLVISENICRSNIRKMILKCDKAGVLFRPHFKTHYSCTVGNWFLDEGVHSITVTSAPMAEYFSRHGWKDITIAFPLNPGSLPQVNKLSAALDLNICISCVRGSDLHCKGLMEKTGVFIEIDNGYGRSGIRYDDYTSVSRILDILSNNRNAEFRGFLSHAGNTYGKDHEEIRRINRLTLDAMMKLKQHFAHHADRIQISVGDTPSSSICDDFHGADELRPGNFLYYDLMQYTNGICGAGDVAAFMYCPVVAVYPERGEAVIWGGAVHFSKEFLTDDKGLHYGYVSSLDGQGNFLEFTGLRLVSLSQEHGILKGESSEVEKLTPGDTVAVMPVHSCLTAAASAGFTITRDGTTVSTGAG